MLHRFPIQVSHLRDNFHIRQPRYSGLITVGIVQFPDQIISDKPAGAGNYDIHVSFLESTPVMQYVFQSLVKRNFRTPTRRGNKFRIIT